MPSGWGIIKMMRLEFSLLALALLSIFGIVTILPRDGAAVAPSSILVNVAPETPSPGETVTITLNSYTSNLDSVSISWAINGKTSAAGIGKKSFAVTAPEAGKELRVSAELALPDGKVEKEIIIRPAIMSLLWQANDSYVPPFYKGKALPAIGSEIKIVAIPEIKSSFRTVNPKSMVYAWKKDYTNDPAASGYGRNFYTYSTEYLENSNIIGVTASTTDHNYSSSGTLTLGTFEPQIVFYEAKTGTGISWENAVKSGHRIEREAILVAAPYFISPKDIRVPSFIWDWSINNNYVSVPSFRPNFLPLQAEAGTSGVSDIKLEISNKYNLLTSAKKEIRVEF